MDTKQGRKSPANTVPSIEERVAELVLAAGELTAGEAQACARLVADARSESRNSRLPARTAA